jgi:hypothetical protein
MYWLKVCPRCRGDLYEKEDRYGWYIACLQCSYQLTSDEEEVAWHLVPAAIILASPDSKALTRLVHPGGLAPTDTARDESPREKGNESRYTFGEG